MSGGKSKIEESVGVTKTVTFEIPDFTEKIDDTENKKNSIASPKFKVCGKEFYICVYPEDYRDGSTHIAVYLHNPSDEKIKTIYQFKHESGVKFNRKVREIDARSGIGHDKFLSHVAYKKWAEDHGDIFRVEVEITERYVHVLYFCRKGL